MLKLVSKNEREQSPEFRKGRWEAFGRIKSISAVERSKSEWAGLLFVFRLVTKWLEFKVKSFERKEAQLRRDKAHIHVVN